MLFGQERIRHLLDRAIRDHRVAHAYLFYGAQGVGKQAVALDFAAKLMGEGEDKARRGMHADIHILFPAPKDMEIEEAAERLRRIRADWYTPIDFIRLPTTDGKAPKSARQPLFTVDNIRELITQAGFKPVEAPVQVFILLDADLMNVQAANAFLKLLEEPNSQSIFILITSKVERMLPTIVSRCQKIRFDLIQPETIAQALIEKLGTSPTDARLFAQMGDGALVQALELATSEDLTKRRNAVVDFFRFAYTQNVPKLSEAIKELSGLRREEIKRFLLLMLLWVRDLATFQATGNLDRIVNLDLGETIQKFCKGVPHAQLEDIVGLIEETIHLTERNVNLNLIFHSFQFRLHDALRGKSVPCLAEPLA